MSKAGQMQRPTLALAALFVVTVTGCSGGEPLVAPASPSAATAPATQGSPEQGKHHDTAADVRPYTLLDTCGAGPFRRPTGFALACGDAGLYVDRIRYHHYSNRVATGTAVLKIIPSTASQNEELDRKNFPVRLRVNRVRSWHGQAMFTRIHLTYLNGKPEGVNSVFVIPLYGPRQHEDIPTNVHTFIAAGGPTCRDSQLSVTATGREGAGGWNVAGFRVRNISDQVCALNGPVTFRGLDKRGVTITDISSCREPTRFVKCSAPTILFPKKDADGHRRTTEVVTPILGWNRGSDPTSDACPASDKLQPATFQMTYGGLTLVATNRRGDRAMWGCGTSLGIAEGRP
jgi:hypothetical protein